jgi:hypothetical protein
MNEYAVSAPSFEELPVLIERVVKEHPELTNWWADMRGGLWVAEPEARYRPPVKKAQAEVIPDPNIEKDRIHKAYLAMVWLEAGTYPVRVRSRIGMERLLRKAFGIRKDKPLVHWSWPAKAVARSHRSRGWS